MTEAFCSKERTTVQEEAADAKVKGLAKKVKNAEVALQRARDDLAKLMELCVPQLTWPCCRFVTFLWSVVLHRVRVLPLAWHRHACADQTLRRPAARAWRAASCARRPARWTTARTSSASPPS